MNSLKTCTKLIYEIKNTLEEIKILNKKIQDLEYTIRVLKRENEELKEGGTKYMTAGSKRRNPFVDENGHNSDAENFP